MTEDLTKVIARLTTDGDFLRDLRENSELAMETTGYNIYDAELQALAKLNDGDLDVAIKRGMVRFSNYGRPGP